MAEKWNLSALRTNTLFCSVVPDETAHNELSLSESTLFVILF